MLTDHTGILVSIKTPVSVSSRRRCAWDGRDECHPPKSRNQPCWAAVDEIREINPRQRPVRARRDRKRGRRFNRRITDNGEFKVVGRAGDVGDIPVTGGQGFVLIVQGAATIPIIGDVWDNTQ